MRRVVAITVVLGFTVTAGVTVASAQRLMVIKVKSVSIERTATNVSPSGPPRKGERLTERARLVNVTARFGQKAGAMIGSDSSTLTVTGPKTGCVTGSATLPGGSIKFQGCARLGVDVPIPVIGGTGAFKGAHGTAIAGPANTPFNTYRLSLP